MVGDTGNTHICRHEVTVLSLVGESVGMVHKRFSRRDWFMGATLMALTGARALGRVRPGTLPRHRPASVHPPDHPPSPTWRSPARRGRTSTTGTSPGRRPSPCSTSCAPVTTSSCRWPTASCIAVTPWCPTPSCACLAVTSPPSCRSTTSASTVSSWARGSWTGSSSTRPGTCRVSARTRRPADSSKNPRTASSDCSTGTCVPILNSASTGRPRPWLSLGTKASWVTEPTVTSATGPPNRRPSSPSSPS